LYWLFRQISDLLFSPSTPAMPSRVTLFDQCDDAISNVSFAEEPPLRHQKSFRRLASRDRQEIFSGDIRSSTRLTGYVMGGIGCLVVSVSAILFKQYGSNYRGSIVIPWKVDAAIAFSMVGLVIFLIIVLGHFDTWFYQKMWSRVFKNGSLVERNIIYSLMIYWTFGLWVCTSVGSPGMNQTNVLISSWIVVAAIIAVFLEWRDAAVRGFALASCITLPDDTLSSQ